MGHVEVLYVTELVGMLLTWVGYRMSIRPVVPPAPAAPEPRLVTN